LFESIDFGENQPPPKKKSETFSNRWLLFYAIYSY
jgi:hypothetical protein